MHSLAIALLVSGLGVEFAQAPAESENPMHRFKPFIGTWNYQGTEQLSPSEPIAKVEFECKISFLPGEKVLLVDNTSLDGSYRFFGFHSFDPATGKYLNWAVGSAGELGWAVGEFNDSGTEIVFIDQSIEVVGSGSLGKGRSVWRMVGGDRQEWEWVATAPDGKEFVGSRGTSPAFPPNPVRNVDPRECYSEVSRNASPPNPELERTAQSLWESMNR